MLPDPFFLDHEPVQLKPEEFPTGQFSPRPIRKSRIELSLKLIEAEKVSVGSQRPVGCGRKVCP